MVMEQMFDDVFLALGIQKINTVCFTKKKKKTMLVTRCWTTLNRTKCMFHLIK